MMCGIGPLAVKSAVKNKNLKVVCNDLNPEGIRYAKENIQLNKVHKRVLPFNMDGREFIKFHVEQSQFVDEPEKLKIPKEFLRFNHCHMNLPVLAVEFLDAFVGLFGNYANPKVWFADPSDPKTLILPMIHVYGFTYAKEKDEALTYFVERIGKALDYPEFKATDIACFHNNRDVSSTSHMYCVSFKLPYKVAMRKDRIVEDKKVTIYEDFENVDDKKKQKV